MGWLLDMIELLGERFSEAFREQFAKHWTTAVAIGVWIFVCVGLAFGTNETWLNNWYVIFLAVVVVGSLALKAITTNQPETSDQEVVERNKVGDERKEKLIEQYDAGRRDFRNQVLRQLDLTDAILCGADLSGSNLSGTDFSGADLFGARLRTANLRGVNLRGADLSRADLSEANLYRADLSRAVLSGADLRGADLSWANLSKAQLAAAKSLEGATMPDGTKYEDWVQSHPEFLRMQGETAAAKAIYHHGLCHQCNGEGDVTTIPGPPFDLSLCGACLALLIADAAGIRSAIRERWALHNKQAADQRDKRPTEL
jgi:hypothetical protein